MVANPDRVDPDPDPTIEKKPGSDWIRIHISVKNRVLESTDSDWA